MTSGEDDHTGEPPLPHVPRPRLAAAGHSLVGAPRALWVHLAAAVHSAAAVVRRRRASRRHRYSTATKVLTSLAVLAAAVLVGGSLSAYLVFRHDWNSITRIDVQSDLNSHPRPKSDPNALNILLIGSDSRGGVNKRFGAEVAGQRSDTIMVMHISPGAHRVDVLSIPRDSMVPILACTAEPGAAGQQAQPGQEEQINATFAYGGPGCLWETIEQTTGIRLNDFIELTFTGFEHVINDIGGVNVCLPVAVHDPDSRLNLSAGMHHVDGAEALAFWRARYIGEGSDLQRIQRDQYLMASLLQGIRSSGLTHSPLKILRVIQDIADNHYIATDTGLTVSRLYSIAEELRGLPSGAVQFIEVPTVPYPANPLNWVEFEQPQSNKLFAAIAHDTKLPKESKASNSAGVLDSVSPGKVSVTVLNGTTRPNLATTTSAGLTRLGFHVVGPPLDAASLNYTKSVIEYYSKADLPAARTLAARVGHATLRLDRSLTSHGTLVLILGSSFTKLTTSAGTAASSSTSAAASVTPSPSASPSSGTSNLASQYGGISGNVSICSDAGAFSGPDGTN